MLLDPALDGVLQPVSNFAQDWMHTMVVPWVWNTTLFLLFAALIEAGVRNAVEQVHAYISMWKFPKRLGINV